MIHYQAMAREVLSVLRASIPGELYDAALSAVAQALELAEKQGRREEARLPGTKPGNPHGRGSDSSGPELAGQGADDMRTSSILEDPEKLKALAELAKQIKEVQRIHTDLWEKYRELYQEAVHDRQVNPLPKDLRP